jgi:hypothetical protein
MDAGDPQQPGEHEVRFELRLGDADLADELEGWLAESGASSLKRREEYGILPVLPIVIGAVVALTAVANLVMWIRSRTGCQVLIDARAEKIRKEVDCSIRDGRIIVVARDDVKVEIIEAPDILDMNKVLSAAISSGGEAVKALAQQSGAQVAVS